MKLRERLDAEIASVKGMVKGPDDKVQPGEVVLGRLTDPDLRRLYVVGQRLEDKLKKMQATILEQQKSWKRGDRDGRSKAIAIGEFYAENDFSDFINKYFWVSVRAELSTVRIFQLYQEFSSVALREDWQIVGVPKKPSELDSLVEQLTNGHLLFAYSSPSR
jgi:hypothetical protein